MSIVISREADTHFCIIQTRESQPFLKNIKIHFESLSQQTYQNFEIVYHLKTDGEIESYKKVAEQILPGKSKILKSLDNINKNVYEASTQKCPQDSMIVFLNEDEEFFEKNSLEKLEREIRADGSLAVLTPFMHQGNEISPDRELINLQRDIYFDLFNKPRSELNIIHNLTRHMRVFRWELYRSIMPTNFHGDNDTWYRSKAAFQLPLLELTIHSAGQSRWYPKGDFWFFISEPTFSSQPLFISNFKDEKYFYAADINEFSLKHRAIPAGHSVQSNRQGGCRYPRFLGSKSKSLNYLNKKVFQEPVIPRIIHQIWLGGPIPETKMRYMNRFEELMPDWQHRIWNHKDITRQKFPFTYEYLRKLLMIVKETKINKFAQMADLMRLQIIYHHGGFYMDTNIEPFKSYQPLRYGRTVFFSVENERNEDYIQNSFIASEKNSPVIRRIIDKDNLDFIDFQSWNVNYQTGPIILARGFTFEEHYLESKVLATHQVFGYLPKTDRRSIFVKCAYNQEEELKEIEGQYEYTYEHNNKKMIFPCAVKYPTAFAVNHLYFGGTWYKNFMDKLPDWLNQL